MSESDYMNVKHLARCEAAHGLVCAMLPACLPTDEARKRHLAAAKALERLAEILAACVHVEEE